MTPVERLRAAADRLEALDKAASESPWEISEEHGCDFSGEGYSYITLSMRDTDGDVAKWYGETTREHADAELILALRPLAPVIAQILRAPIRHVEGLLAEENQVRGIEMFAPHALALADLVLGEAS